MSNRSSLENTKALLAAIFFAQARTKGWLRSSLESALSR
jgi:hypothetical protein